MTETPRHRSRPEDRTDTGLTTLPEHVPAALPWRSHIAAHPATWYRYRPTLEQACQWVAYAATVLIAVLAVLGIRGPLVWCFIVLLAAALATRAVLAVREALRVIDRARQR